MHALDTQDRDLGCPVCWRYIRSTRWGGVARHWDSIGRDICPMSHQPYDLMEVGRHTATTVRGRVA